MANYTAADIKALRETTGAGMMDVKRALDEADGNAQQAAESLRIKGLKGVTKREGRSASNGLVAAEVDGGVGTLIEVNCETDFVAKGNTFMALADRVLAHAVATKAADAAALLASELVARVEGPAVVSYLHKTSPDLPPQIGVLLAYDGDAATAKDVAMHIAAFAPSVLSREDISPETVETERRIALETAKEEGKPEAALPKIVEGRVNGFFAEHVLLEQKFAKDQKKTVQAVLTEGGVQVRGFARIRVGN